MDKRNYYEAYEDRYLTAHSKGVSWSSDKSTPIVLETIQKYKLNSNSKLLEIGCGEGRDSATVLDSGFNLMATDVSPEAIRYCKEKYPKYADNFHVLDCLSGGIDNKFDFIYAVAVVHMLVLNEDRNGFYRFIHRHLTDDGYALICSMGDGEFEMQSDVKEAFDIQERNHETGKMLVAATSCRMVSFKVFDDEITRNNLEIVEKGITISLPDFNNLMYAVVKRSRKRKPSVIETERLILRSMCDTDCDDVCSLLTNKQIAKTYMLPDFKSREEEIKLFNLLMDLSNDLDRFVFGIDLGGRIIGFINDVEISDDSIELGFVIHPDHHNKGYATETLTHAIDTLHDMGYATVKTGAFECNLASQRVMEKAGMQRLNITEEIEYRGVMHRCIMFEKRAR